MKQIINDFRFEYRWLSNYHLCNILYDGIMYPSSENAYQASKSVNKEIREQFVDISPKNARKLGRNIILRDNWENIKRNIMFDITMTKFLSNRDLAYKLLQTKDAYLIEGNTWGDTYWGVCNGVGKNNLGIILMQVRKQIVHFM